MDEISSIREERQQFMEQNMSGEMSVFNKILQDYQKYRNKKKKWLLSSPLSPSIAYHLHRFIMIKNIFEEALPFIELYRRLSKSTPMLGSVS